MAKQQQAAPGAGIEQTVEVMLGGETYLFGEPSASLAISASEAAASEDGDAARCMMYMHAILMDLCPAFKKRYDGQNSFKQFAMSMKMSDTERLRRAERVLNENWGLPFVVKSDESGEDVFDGIVPEKISLTLAGRTFEFDEPSAMTVYRASRAIGDYESADGRTVAYMYQVLRAECSEAASRWPTMEAFLSGLMFRDVAALALCWAKMRAMFGHEHGVVDATATKGATESFRGKSGEDGGGAGQSLRVDAPADAEPDAAAASGAE
jgi:hypothetical protein